MPLLLGIVLEADVQLLVHYRLLRSAAFQDTGPLS